MGLPLEVMTAMYVSQWPRAEHHIQREEKVDNDLKQRVPQMTRSQQGPGTSPYMLVVELVQVSY